MRTGANPAFVFSNSLFPIWPKTTLEGTVIKCLPLAELVMLHSGADVKKHFSPNTSRVSGNTAGLPMGGASDYPVTWRGGLVTE